MESPKGHAGKNKYLMGGEKKWQTFARSHKIAPVAHRFVTAAD